MKNTRSNQSVILRRGLVASALAVASISVAPPLTFAASSADLRSETTIFSAQISKRSWDLADKTWSRYFSSLVGLEQKNYLRRMSELPEKKGLFNFTSSDKRSVRRQIDILLRKHLEVIGSSTLADLQASASKLRAEIGELQEKASYCSLMASVAINERATIPTRVFNFVGWQVFRRECPVGWRKVDLEKRSSELRQMADSRLEVLNDIKLEMMGILEKNGLKVSMEQLEAQFLTASGADEARIISIFKNLEAGLSHFQEEMRRDSNGNLDIVLAQKYYGAYALMIRTLWLGHCLYVDRIDNQILPRLESLTKVLKTEISENEALIQTATLEIEKSQYPVNLKIRQNSLRAAEIYSSFINRRREKIVEAMGNLELRYRVAENTYLALGQTTEISGLFSDISVLESLVNLRAPEMETFESEEIRAEFIGLTERLDQLSKR